MKAYTGKGDTGETSLFLQGRVKKDDLRIECLGELDELNSFLGLSKAAIKAKAIKRIIQIMQNDIYIISSEIAAPERYLNKLKIRLSKVRLLWLQTQINKFYKKAMFKECCFFIPGENFASAALDICRTICRRAERRVVSLNRKIGIKNPLIIPFLNRLSSLLFVLARVTAKSSRFF